MADSVAKKRDSTPKAVTESAAKRRREQKRDSDKRCQRSKVNIAEQSSRWNALKLRLGFAKHANLARLLLDRYELSMGESGTEQQRPVDYDNRIHLDKIYDKWVSFRVHFCLDDNTLAKFLMNCYDAAISCDRCKSLIVEESSSQQPESCAITIEKCEKMKDGCKRNEDNDSTSDNGTTEQHSRCLPHNSQQCIQTMAYDQTVNGLAMECSEENEHHQQMDFVDNTCHLDSDDECKIDKDDPDYDPDIEKDDPDYEPGFDDFVLDSSVQVHQSETEKNISELEDRVEKGDSSYHPDDTDCQPGHEELPLNLKIKLQQTETENATDIKGGTEKDDSNDHPDDTRNEQELSVISRVNVPHLETENASDLKCGVEKGDLNDEPDNRSLDVDEDDPDYQPNFKKLSKCDRRRKTVSTKKLAQNYYYLNDGKNSVCLVKYQPYLEVVRSVTDESTVPYDISSSSLSTQGNQRQVTDVKYRCKVCGVVSKNLIVVRKHILYKEMGELVECSECGKSVSKRGMYTHERIHKQSPRILKLVECSFEGCNYNCKFASRLKDHVKKVHSGQTEMCSWEGCGKRFKTAYSLKVHERTHTGDKPYVCFVCGYQCSQKASLNWHMKSKHPDIDLSSFLC